MPELRKDPQTVMRDVNQLLYRVFNSKKVHVYATIDHYSEDVDRHNGEESNDSSSSTLKVGNSVEESDLVII